MSSLNDAPSWADQWGAGNGEGDDKKPEEKKGGENKMAKVKSVASTSFNKAKSATITGAGKVKSGAGVGFSWLKNQYQKRTSK